MAAKLIDVIPTFREVLGIHRIFRKTIEKVIAALPEVKVLQAGDNFYVSSEEDLAKVRSYLEESRRKVSVHGVRMETAHAPDAESLRRIEELETLVLEQDEKIDGLHAGMEKILNTYISLKAAALHPELLPDVPVLPTRYKYKIVLIGGNDGLLSKLQQRFPKLKIRGVSFYDKQPSRTTWPQGDLIIHMTSMSGHNEAETAARVYGQDRIMRIPGSLSSVESAISVWLHEKEKAVEEARR